MSGEHTGNKGIEDLLATSSPEEQERIKKALRDPNFYVAESLEEVVTLVGQILGNKPKQ